MQQLNLKEKKDHALLLMLCCCNKYSYIWSTASSSTDLSPNPTRSKNSEEKGLRSHWKLKILKKNNNPPLEFRENNQRRRRRRRQPKTRSTSSAVNLSSPLSFLLHTHVVTKRSSPATHTPTHPSTHAERLRKQKALKEKEFKENTTLFESGGWVGRWVDGCKRDAETRNKKNFIKLLRANSGRPPTTRVRIYGKFSHINLSLLFARITYVV